MTKIGRLEITLGSTHMPEESLYRNLISRVNLGDLLIRSAARAPGRLAIVDADRRLTYREFNEWVNRKRMDSRASAIGAAMPWD
jgi:non-ribosomal peptide synthetase component E (peptide arylation enzyme)